MIGEASRKRYRGTLVFRFVPTTSQEIERQINVKPKGSSILALTREVYKDDPVLAQKVREGLLEGEWGHIVDHEYVKMGQLDGPDV